MDRTATATGTAFVYTIGCQMNELDSELALGALSDSGITAVSRPADADVLLVNTCSVREKAEEKAYSWLGRMKALKRSNPDLIIGVLGCMAQKEGKLIFRRAPYVDIVAGTAHFTRIDDYVRQVRATGKRVLAIGRDEEVQTEKRLKARETPQSSYVAVMRGCDHHCTYCVVPNTRGAEQSRELEEIVEECRILVGEGTQEITLLGQNIDSYGKRLRPRRRTLAELLYAVADVPGLKRLRFVTSHPSDLKPELFQAFRDLPNLMPYLHFPAQSGSDEVLKRMRRGYTHARYMELVAAAREAVPEIGLAGDTIVGFCGETEEDFERTLELHEKTRYQASYIFMYSERDYTPAKDQGLKDDVPLEVKKRRINKLMQLQREWSLAENQRKIGKVYEVFGEGPSRKDSRKQEGRNPQHQVVLAESGRDLSGQFYKVEITSATDAALYGKLV
ncbi:MAG: tRNA (N6-isopentenyl adenosine(37)-C2)-methylthiotransferase MiaB [Planctomycetes bacterium]|nr:tRNA (N6-isopentenyl adenosine(37)-C2)-methylthiotransferase MiaB [Planctomycetota bacterium]MCW8136056.1 tRNA (N6-isopentenyl adenosine(37)-C2)-methylthiotransferase MiaB [Planctomycetota bacterium]